MVLVAVILIVLVVNSISSSCGSSKILTWTGKYKSGVIVGKYNLGTSRACFKKIKRSGIGRFVKSVLFEKNIFLNISETYQK